jgi:hypothetical protein
MDLIAYRRLNEADAMLSSDALQPDRFAIGINTAELRLVVRALRTGAPSDFAAAEAVARQRAACRGCAPNLVMILALLGRIDEAYGVASQHFAEQRPPKTLEALFGDNDGATAYDLEFLADDPYRALRSDPRFLRLWAGSGPLELWRRTGHGPDFCHPDGRPSDCKAVAERIKPPF